MYLYAYLARGTLLWIAGAAFLVMVVINSLGGSSEETFQERYGPAVIFVSAFIPFIFVLLYLLAWKRWSSAQEIKAMREYEMDETGMRIKSDLFQTAVEWRIFKFADLWGGDFFLRTGQNSYHSFPVSAVPDRHLFLELISNYVKTSKRWKEALHEKKP